MKIDQPWLRTPATRNVCIALSDGGAEVFFVGGCVRNALLKEPVSDLDLATSLSPQDVLERANRAGLKAVPTGIEHGTVTILSEGQPFEVTTFRKDVATDGRRAVVAFSSSVREDAQRRDFTMNAIYARPDGEVVDPLDGLSDLHARRVRFIGDASTRIKEDYLRILRYFRFHCWYGKPEDGFDPEALAAIAETQDGLEQLSRERVGVEIVKLLSAHDPAPCVAAMRQIGVLARVLPGANDRALAPLIHLEGDLAPQAETRLATLGSETLQADLRLSKAMSERIRLLRDLAVGSTSPSELAYRHGAETAKRALILRAALLETSLQPTLETDISIGAAAIFPVAAKDLMPRVSGPALGRALRALEAEWIESGFVLTREELIATLRPD
ncbi:CCA tRNA nucleotidyltransferase [Tritonibacter horizontis]|uniref:CCA-adding enzyme n=1 Tax=Tritonibacter horizontis TaxID=1768241 RepID=A0A132C2Q3_9RHOB|nr:CCA tRNA nucleotidyltransferase [Tritonibacter horizontis]KUP94844.1 CCA-adding enzyme [Tritonibacter horizontis]